MKNGLDEQYIDLLNDILKNGVEKDTRNGKVLSVFGRTIRYKFKDGKFPLLTTKKMYMKGIVTELIWFLRGDTNIKYLVDNGCNIWNGDAYKKYIKDSEEFSTSEQVEYGECTYSASGMSFRPFSIEGFINKIKTDDEFAERFGNLGKIYGYQWRNWNGEIDQISDLIKQLKENPDSRRLLVSAWAVHDLPNMALPPCHYGFQVYTRELSLEERVQYLYYKTDLSMLYLIQPTEEQLNKENIPSRAISLMFNMRSNDVPLGLPFNLASYGLLLEILAKQVNMVPDELIANLGDAHIYLNQIDGVKEQIGRELRVDERVCMCYENPNLDLSRLQEGMSDEEFTKICDEFNIPTRTRTPYPLPTLNINTEFWPYEGGECGVGPLHSNIDVLIKNMTITDFEIIGYQSHPTIKMPLSN